MNLTASVGIVRKHPLFSSTVMAIDKIYKNNIRNLLQSRLNNPKTDYEEAVEKLNYLQSNSVALKECEKNVARGLNNKSNEKTKLFLKRIGISSEEIDSKLSVIHVSGTKGKGSSCAYCESVLRHYGYKTGFYSSPHLIAVRERIRIDGQPISESDFSYYFWDVYRKLEANRDEHDGTMPFYFSFLTVMAIRIFLAEKVDVAIIEVGIGGENDSTNIFNYTPVVGITSLGKDHTALLGDTIEKIAWQKAGVMKKGSIAITANNQPPSALRVLHDRAKEKECDLVTAPLLEEYKSNSELKQSIGLGTIHEINASVGLQLAYAWLAKCKNRGNLNNVGKGFILEKESILGIKRCFWPGRQHIVSRKNGNLKFFIDGAHTVESMAECSNWFKTQINGNNSLRVLLFNITSNRDASSLLKPLLSCNFDIAIFCTNIPRKGLQNCSDQANLTITDERQLLRSVENEKAWIELNKLDSEFKGKSCKVFSTVEDSIQFIESLSGNISVLVTGSLHLVGAVFSNIDSNLILSNLCGCENSLPK